MIRRKALRARERDAIVADVKALLSKHRVSGSVFGRFAFIADRELRDEAASPSNGGGAS